MSVSRRGFLTGAVAAAVSAALPALPVPEELPFDWVNEPCIANGFQFRTYESGQHLFFTERQDTLWVEYEHAFNGSLNRQWEALLLGAAQKP